MRGAVAQSVRAITAETMKPEQINQRIADLRNEAAALRQSSDNQKKDAARLYRLADKVWAARIAVEAVLSEQMKIGFPYEPDALREKANEALEKLINGGHLG